MNDIRIGHTRAVTPINQSSASAENKEVAKVSEQVTTSAERLTVETGEQILKQAPAIDKDRIELVKRQIASGELSFDMDAVAKVLARGK